MSLEPAVGRMLWFNEEKNLGAIETDDGERLAVRGSAFVPGHTPVGRCAGLAVAFRVRGHEGERAAVDVCVVPEQLHGRARRRHARGGSF